MLRRGCRRHPFVVCSPPSCSESFALCQAKSKPHKEGLYYGLTAGEYDREFYPPWAGGPSYFVSQRLAAAIAQAHARKLGKTRKGNSFDWSIGGPTGPVVAARRRWKNSQRLRSSPLAQPLALYRHNRVRDVI